MTGKVRDMAHSAEDINWGARKRVEDWSQRPAAPVDMAHHKKQSSGFWSGLFCLTMAALLIAVWVIWI